MLINLTQPSVIVMDNATYHSILLEKTPNSLWKKTFIQELLIKKQTKFNYTMFKAELLSVVVR